MSSVFSSSLKGVAFNWFYSFSRHSPQNFEELRQAFYNQYASRHEFKNNNNHLLTVKMKPTESLKHCVSYFQSQMALVYNYNEDVAAVAFISGLQLGEA